MRAILGITFAFVAAADAFAQSSDICPVLRQLIEEAPRGFPSSRGELVDIGLGWYRCKNPIPGATICKVDLSQDDKDIKNVISHNWQRSSMEDALSTSEALAEAASACDLGAYLAADYDAEPEERVWRIKVDGGIESDAVDEGVTIRFKARMNERANAPFALMEVTYSKTHW